MSYNNQSRKGTCFNFQKGSCKFGDDCKYAHERNGDGGGNDRNSGGERLFQNRQSYDGNDNNRSSSYNNDREGGGGNYSGEKRRNSDYGGSGGGGNRSSYSGGGGGRGGGSTYQHKPKKPASMIEHMEPVLDPAVQMAKELLIKLGDMTDNQWTNEEDVAAVVPALATALVESGDLTTFVEEISELFTDCLSSLPVQTSLIATVLALIAKSSSGNTSTTVTEAGESGGVNNRDIKQEGYVFASRVMEKLTQKFITSLSEHDILACKLILRAFSSLVCCKALAMSDYITLLDVLLTVAYAGWSTTASHTGNGTKGNGTNSSNKSTLNVSGQIATYLLATTLPWSLHTLFESHSVTAVSTSAASSVVERAQALFTRVVSEYRSPYSSGGKLAIFHWDTAATTAEERRGSSGGEMNNGYDEMIVSRLNVGPVGIMCWDTLYETCQSTSSLITAVSVKQPQSQQLQLQLQLQQLPECMLTPWTKLQDVLSSADTANLNNGNSASGVLVFHAGLIDAVKSSFTVLSTPTTTVVNAINTTNHHQQQQQQQWLRPCFSIFDSNSSQPAREIAESLTYLEKTIVMESYRDILHFFNPMMREDGTREGQLETLCAHLLAVSKFFPSIQHLEYILVETLLVLLTQLPLDTVHYSCCCRVLLELCKTHHTIRPILALGVSIVFQYGSEMDTSVWRSLAQWLSFHLVNTKLAWPYWQHWSNEFNKQLTDLSINTTTAGNGTDTAVVRTEENNNDDGDDNDADNYEGLLFIRLVLDKCTRAMVRDQVLSTLPQSLHILVPVHSPPHCVLLTDGSGSSGEATAMTMATDDVVAVAATEGGGATSNNQEQIYTRQLFDLIESRAECDVIEDWLDGLDEIDINIANGDNDTAAGTVATTGVHWRLRVLTQAVFAAGGREATNVSVLQSLFDRYSSALRMFADSTEAQHALLSYVLEVYATTADGAALNLTLDSFLRRGIVTADMVCTHLTQPHSLTTLVNDVWLYTHLETVTDRAVDVLRACVQLYTSLTSKYGHISSGSGTSGSESNSSADAVMNTGVDEDNVATIGGGGRRGDDDENDSDIDEEEVSSRRRFARNDDNITAATSTAVVAEGDATMMMSSSENSPITTAYDPLLVALTTCRSVYKTLIGTLLTQIAFYRPQSQNNTTNTNTTTDEGTETESKVAAFQLAAVSLMMRVLRAMHTAQTECITPTLVQSLHNTAATRAVTLQESDITLIDVAGVEDQIKFIEHQLSTGTTVSEQQLLIYKHAAHVAFRSFL